MTKPMQEHPHIPRQPRRIYLPLMLVWLLMLVLIISFIISIDLRTAEHDFSTTSNTLYQQVSNRLQTNETVLEGFATLLDVMDKPDDAKIRLYARRMLEQYPHIYMFEIVQTIPASRLAGFVRQFRQFQDPDFQLHRFDYDGLRQRQPIVPQPYYMPITFMEPFTAENRGILGLDLAATPYFITAMRQAAKNHHAASTRPFRLIEGQLAYLLLRPVTNVIAASNPHTHTDGLHDRYAILVILADSLIDKQTLATGYDLELVSTSGLLYNQHGKARSRLETWLFPRLVIRRNLDSRTQPFVLTVSKQLGWQDINRGFLAFISFIALIAFFIVILYARVYSRAQAEQARMADRLFYLANHDDLTGLPNRNLLMDRLGHAIAQSGRQSGRLALVYLDLDGFKQVNDTHGHDYGDNILRRVAERLRASLREGDTIARLGGDEFVIIVENIDSRRVVNQIIDKIKAGFSQPFVIDTLEIKLGVSAGFAIYPDDGKDMDSLLSHADAAMYMDKRQLTLLDRDTLPP